MSEWKAKKEDTAVLCVLLYNHQQIYLHYSGSRTTVNYQREVHVPFLQTGLIENMG